MKYQDSLQAIKQLQSTALRQLKEWQLAVTPNNYAVSYEFAAQSNTALTTAIKYQLATGKRIDGFYIETIYQEFIVGNSQFRDEMLMEFDQLLNALQNNAIQSNDAVDNFISELAINFNDLTSGQLDKITLASNNVKKATIYFKSEHEKLINNFQSIQNKGRQLQDELEGTREDFYLDPLTGLFNRKAMFKYLDTWYKKDPAKNIAIVVLYIEHYQQLSEEFGVVTTEKLLQKVASKIEKYVDDRGLPIRTGDNEFVLLAPGLNDNAVSALSTKIRQSIEGISLMNAKSGEELPSLNIAIGVNRFDVSHNINAIIDKTRSHMNVKERVNC